jgi:oligopeptide transport system permease protein
MWRFIGFRVLQSVPVILVVITVTFFLVRLGTRRTFLQ